MNYHTITNNKLENQQTNTVTRRYSRNINGKSKQYMYFVDSCPAPFDKIPKDIVTRLMSLPVNTTVEIQWKTSQWTV